MPGCGAAARPGTVVGVSPATGPLFAAALLLGAAGALKALDPDPTRIALRTAGLPGAAWMVRIMAVGEMAIAVAVIGWAGRLGAGLILAAYLGFAGFSLRVMTTSRGKASCGCFGASDAPIGTLHVGVNLAVALIAVLALIDPAPGIVGVADATPLGGVVFVAFAAMLAWLLQLVLTGLPELQAAARPPRKVAR